MARIVLMRFLTFLAFLHPSFAMQAVGKRAKGSLSLRGANSASAMVFKKKNTNSAVHDTAGVVAAGSPIDSLGNLVKGAERTWNEAASTAGELLESNKLPAFIESAERVAAGLKDSASQLEDSLSPALDDVSSIVSKVNVSWITSEINSSFGSSIQDMDMGEAASRLAQEVKDHMWDGISTVEQMWSPEKRAIGGITYYQMSEGKYCDVNNNYVFTGITQDCQRKCVQTVGCNYWTGYSNGFCQLSSTCEKEGVAGDPSSRTFAQVNKEATFSQYAVGTRCTSDGGYLAEGKDMDCEQQCRGTEGCYYYTVYGSGYCQLSRTCTKREVGEFSASAITYQAPSAVGPNSPVPKVGTKMCSNGKLLPNLYLLGVQKAGTTSLAGDLVEAGVWNTRQADAIDLPETEQEKEKANDGKPSLDGASYGALVSAAGTIVGDLMSAGVMKPEDLSLRTKQAIADDMVAAGILSADTMEHLDDNTKKSLATDLVAAGMLNKMKVINMDNKTQTLLSRDLVQACFMNITIAQSLDQDSKRQLARDLVHASVAADVFANLSSNKLRNRTKQMLAVDFVWAGALKTGLVDHISDAAKGSLVQDALSNNLVDPNFAESMSMPTKQSIANNLINAKLLNGDMIGYLANNTKKSLAADIVSAGKLKMAPSSSLQPNTKQWLAFDINRVRAQNGWNIMMANELDGDGFGQNVKDIEPGQLSDQTKMFLVEDLARSSDLFGEAGDLSFATKQLLTSDLMRAGRLSSLVVHFTADTKSLFAHDLIQSGIINGNTISQMSDQTKTLLADDLIAAGALKGAGNFASRKLGNTTNESLAGDLLRAGLIYERLALVTDMYLAWDIVRAGLLTNQIADKLSTETKQSVVSKLQSNGLFTSDLADHLDPSTKASLGGDFIRQANFLDMGDQAQNLQNSTKLSITNNLIASGIMKHTASVWSTDTRELIVSDIMSAGLQNYTEPYTKGFMDVTTKESHFFEHAVLEGYNYANNLHAGVPMNWTDARRGWKQLWMNRLVDCPKDDAAKPVYADFTPANMRMVPLPDGTRAQGRQWGILGDAIFNVNQTVPSDLAMNLPQAMDEFYGADKNKITFVIMLREPLARMQSAYYHAKNSPGSGPCVECKGSSFSLAMNVTLSFAKGLTKHSDVPTYRDWLWTSMYARQLEHWFQYFHPSQFYVIPTFIYSKGSNIQICKDLSARVKTDIDCAPFKKTIAEQRNTHDHPPIEEDSTLGLRMRFYDVMNPENERLVKVLAEASKQGLGLAAYDGNRGDEMNIKEWLVKNW